MKVKKLIKLLNKQNQDAEVFAYLGAKEGWEIVEFGYGDAIIGNGKTEKNSNFVLIPVTVPENYQDWEKDERVD